MRMCLYCKSDISALRAGCHVCRSPACRARRKADWQRRHRQIRPCPVCGRTIDAANRRYCSDECLAEYRRAYMLDRYYRDHDSNKSRSLAYYHSYRAGNAEVAARQLLYARAHYHRHAADEAWMERRRRATNAWRARLASDPEKRAEWRARATIRRGERRLEALKIRLGEINGDDDDSAG